MQLTRNDYIRSDINRWQTMDFVVGYEIKLSNNPNKECVICTQLAGKYPKSFMWTEWHDGCKCQVYPIMMNRDEFNKDEFNELRAALHGTEYIPIKSKNFIDILPKNFIFWYFNNVEKMVELHEFPDFVVQNIDLISSSINFYKQIHENNKSK